MKLSCVTTPSRCCDSLSGLIHVLCLQEHAALLHAWIKLELSSSQPNIKQLFGHVQKLQAAKPGVALLKPLWATISAAAAASTESMATALGGVVRAWRGQADDDSAEVNADLLGLDAMQAHQAGHKHKARPNALDILLCMCREHMMQDNAACD